MKICNMVYEYSGKNGEKKLNNEYYSEDVVMGCLFLKYSYSEDVVMGCLFLKLNTDLLFYTLFKNPLIYACKYTPSIVPDLLEAGAKVNGSDNGRHGWTPLTVACHHSPTIVPDLLKAGANVNGSDNNGSTPLIHACQYSPLSVPNLLEFGAKVNISNVNIHLQLFLIY